MSVGSALICAVVYGVLRWVEYCLLSWQCLTRPLVVAPLVGALLGDLNTGLIMGAQLEAIFMGISAIGGSVPSDCLSGSILAVAYAVTVGGSAAMETGLSLALALGTIMATLSGVLMALWGVMSAYWEKLASECKPKKFLIQAFVVAALAEIPGSAVIFLGCKFGVEGLQTALANMPAWVLTGLATSGTMMTAVGFGILLSMIWSTDICVWYFVGFVLAKSLGLSSLGIAVIGVAIAITIFLLEKNVVDAKKSMTAAAPAANSEEDFF